MRTSTSRPLRSFQKKRFDGLPRLYRPFKSSETTSFASNDALTDQLRFVQLEWE